MLKGIGMSEDFVAADGAPDTEVMEQYYELWLDGQGADDIRACLGVTAPVLKRWGPFLQTYCRHRLAHDTRADLVRGFVKDRAWLTPRRRAELFKYVGAGGDVSKALRVMGIPLVTYTEVWCKEDPDLREECEMLVDKWDLDTAAALHLRAVGHEHPFRTVTTTKSQQLDEAGRVVDLENVSVSEGTKVAYPDFNSLRFELINRMPEKYTLDGMGNGSGARGRILSALDQIIADSTNGDEEKAFDDANEERHK